MNRVRVVMVVRLFHPWIGGMERQAQTLARQLTAGGTGVEIVTGWWFQGTPRRETIDGIPVFRNHTLWEAFGIRGLRKFGGYLYMLTLAWYLWRRRHRYDVIHVHGLSYHTFVAVLAGGAARRPTITKLANSGEASDIVKMRRGEQLPLTSYMVRTALRSRRLIATTDAIAQELTAAGVPPERIVNLPNGVETDRIRARQDYALRQPSAIVFVGRLHAQKGVDVLLRAFSLIAASETVQPVALTLVGDGPDAALLMRLAAQLRVSERVVFVGSTDGVLAHLSSADVFVLPSRAEGLSNALLEAMASGLPVIASRIPGNSYVVTDRENGLLFEPGDSAGLADRLLELLGDQELRERLGRAARTTVVERYGMAGVAARYVALYRELLDLADPVETPEQPGLISSREEPTEIPRL